MYRAIYTHASKDQRMLDASTFTLTLFFETGTLPKPEACYYGGLNQLTTELPGSIYPCLQCSGVKVCMVTCSSFNTGAVDLNSGSYCFHREHSYPLSLSPVSIFLLELFLYVLTQSKNTFTTIWFFFLLLHGSQTPCKKCYSIFSDNTKIRNNNLLNALLFLHDTSVNGILSSKFPTNSAP